MKLVIVPAALAELQDAAAYYVATANAELGFAFLEEFERATDVIRRNPEMAPVFRRQYRRYLLRRFPYTVIHQHTAEEIRIIAVAHQRRRPGYWTGRQ